MKEKILEACRATHIPEGVAGPWTLNRFTTAKDLILEPGHLYRRPTILPAGTHTQLWRMTMEKLQKSQFGDLVMQDTPQELGTHLEFMLKARGRVLITGLGLGCVARGCAANPCVTEIVVIERDRHVLNLVGKSMLPWEKIEIYHADAPTWVEADKSQWDCAWHDLWSDPDKDEPHLQVTHSRMMAALHGRVRFQGAWQFPRDQRKLWRRLGNIL